MKQLPRLVNSGSFPQQVAGFANVVFVIGFWMLYVKLAFHRIKNPKLVILEVYI
jgi:hypothetical protein